MIALDGTREIVLTPKHLEYIKHINPEMAEFIRQITAKQFVFYWEQEYRIGSIINDPLSLFKTLFPICQGFKIYTEVVFEDLANGLSIVDLDNFHQNEANSIIYTEIDIFQFWPEFLTITLECEIENSEHDLGHFKNFKIIYSSKK